MDLYLGLTMQSGIDKDRIGSEGHREPDWRQGVDDGENSSNLIRENSQQQPSYGMRQPKHTNAE
jgi:hypothetical protein